MARAKQPTALVFVDPTVDQQAHFAYEIAQFAQAELLILDDQVDGIEQITTCLVNHHFLQSLHLVLPSESTTLKLGKTQLTPFNLDRYGWELQQWGEAFAPQARIFLHRWNTPEDFEVSSLFLSRLSLLTGTKVAVADHPICAENQSSADRLTYSVSS